MKWSELKLWRWVVDHRRTLAIASGIWLMLHVDPLGIEEATADRAENTVMRLSSLLYSGSDRVTVVLFDQDFLDSAGAKRSWPLPYGTQGFLLRRLFGNEAVRPSRVFLDLLYKNPHDPGSLIPKPKRSPSEAGGPVDNPYNLLAPIQKLAPAVYLAGLPDQLRCDGKEDVRLDRSSIVDELHHHSLITSVRLQGQVTERVAMVAWAGCESKYPLRLGSGPWALTPAFMLFHDDCVTRFPSFNAPCRRIIDGENEPMTVRWGAFPPRDQEQYYKAGVCQHSANENSLLRFLQSYGGLLRQFAYRLVGVDPAESRDVNVRLPCPAFNVIPAQALMQSPDLSQFADSLKDKIVLIGADIPGVPDTFVSPVHGSVPGVFFHAMALDNLLALQSRYLKEMPRASWIAIEIVVVLLAAFAGTWRAPRAAPKPTHKILRTLVFIASWIGLGALASTIDPEWGFLRVAVGGALATYLVKDEVIKVLCILFLICLVSLLSIEMGWAPKNWMVLVVAAVTAFVTVAHTANEHSHANSHAATEIEESYSARTLTFTVTEVSRKVLRVLNYSRRRSTS